MIKPMMCTLKHDLPLTYVAESVATASRRDIFSQNMVFFRDSKPFLGGSYCKIASSFLIHATISVYPVVALFHKGTITVVSDSILFDSARHSKAHHIELKANSIYAIQYGAA